MADVARHLSLGGMGAPDVAGVRQLLLQIEEHENALSSTAFVAALEGAEPAAITHYVRQVMAHDLASPQSSVGQMLKRAGGAIIAPEFK